MPLQDGSALISDTIAQTMHPLRSSRSVILRRIAYALVLLLASFALFEFWIGPCRAAHSLEKEIEMGVVPTPLRDATQAKAQTRRLKQNGVSFEVPWAEAQESRASSMSGSLFFENGLLIHVDSPSMQLKYLDLVKATRGLGANAIRHQMGDEVLSSEFSILRAALNTTPSEAKWWHSPFYNTRIQVLLMVKNLEASTPFDRPIPIYEVNFGDIRGFQIGDPEGTQAMIKLVLFDQLNHEFRIDLFHTRTNVKQSEINALIASLRSEPEK